MPDSVKLAKILATKGVDLVDISSGGMDPRQKISGGKNYQVAFADDIKKALGSGSKTLVGAVGGIVEGNQAQAILNKNQADVVRISFWSI